MPRWFIIFSPMALAAVLISSILHAGTLVKMRPDFPAAATLGDFSAMTLGWKYLPAVDLYIVDERGRDRLNALKKRGDVEAVESEFDVRLEAVPNDPMLWYQGWTAGPGLNIGASAAWDTTVGSSNVVVALIDTGISLSHPDLMNNVWRNDAEIAGNGKDDDGNGYIDDVSGYNFWEDDGNVEDENGHGSHLAGIIGAQGDNGIGVAGVDWDIRLMPLKFTDSLGNSNNVLAVEAIDYAIRNGADIINASWTLKLSSGDAPVKGSLLRLAIERAEGILFVTASGNQFEADLGQNIDETPVYPASFDLRNIISVAALQESGRLASYSNYGASTVSLAAPGTNILSTVADGHYGFMRGTSVATAVVSGAAALALSMAPDLTPDQLKSVLETSSTLNPSLEGRVVSQGALNLKGLVDTVEAGDFPPPAAAIPSEGEAPVNDVYFPTGSCSLTIKNLPKP